MKTPTLIITGSPASRVAADVFEVHFPDGEVVDMSTPEGRQRLELLLAERADDGGAVVIDIYAR